MSETRLRLLSVSTLLQRLLQLVLARIATLSEPRLGYRLDVFDSKLSLAIQLVKCTAWHAATDFNSIYKIEVIMVRYMFKKFVV